MSAEGLELEPFSGGSEPAGEILRRSRRTSLPTTVPEYVVSAEGLEPSTHALKEYEHEAHSTTYTALVDNKRPVRAPRKPFCWTTAGQIVWRKISHPIGPKPEPTSDTGG